MEFEWDANKSRQNLAKHKIAFETAVSLWSDPDRIEILTPFPLENRYILIARLGGRLWSAVYTLREGGDPYHISQEVPETGEDAL